MHKNHDKNMHKKAMFTKFGKSVDKRGKKWYTTQVAESERKFEKTV